MKRTLTVKDTRAAFALAVRLLHTLNAAPIWGRPAQSLMLDWFAFRPRDDGTAELDFTFTDNFAWLAPGGPPLYNAEDWSALEPSLPLAD